MFIVGLAPLAGGFGNSVIHGPGESNWVPSPATTALGAMPDRYADVEHGVRIVDW